MYPFKKYFRLHDERQRGAASVEFAIVVIIFITLLFAIIEFGLLIYNKQIMKNAVREGARLGIVARLMDSRISVNDITNKVVEYSSGYVVSFGSAAPPVVTVTNSIHGIDTSCTEPADFITVDMSYNYDFLFIPLATVELTSSARMRCE